MAKYSSNYALHTISRDAVLAQKVVDGQVVTEPVAPEPVRFLDGLLETDDPEIIHFLDNHRHNGVYFHRIPDDVIKADPDTEYTPIEGIETVNSAVEYLVETFGVSPDKLRSKKAVQAVAKENGIVFPHLL